MGLLSGITYGAADFIGGLASRRSSTLSVVVISQLSGLVVLLLLLPLLPKATPTQADLIWGLMAGLGGAAGITLLYRGLAIGRMSLVSPITAVVAALIPLAVGLLMRERPSLPALIGVAMALLAVVLVSTTEMPGEPASNAAPGLVGSSAVQGRSAAVRNWMLQPGLIEALLSGVGVGAFYVLLARTHASAGLWPLACSRFASMSVVVAVALGARRSLVPQRAGWLMIIVAGIIDMLANAFYLLATRYGMLAIVAVLASLYPASTVILARIVLHEKLGKLQLAGVVCALVAVGLIAAGN
ncbi:MAG: DMT family transporter [Candidatus Eremiobacteraeota bacterium]|nr:DMT family transporter [Candidatus Eremiobacteraeota bacterium]